MDMRSLTHLIQRKITQTLLERLKANKVMHHN